jgi:uncharacterized protein YceK
MMVIMDEMLPFVACKWYFRMTTWNDNRVWLKQVVILDMPCRVAMHIFLTGQVVILDMPCLVALHTLLTK